MAGLSAPEPLTTAYTISLGSPSEMAAAAERAAWRPLLKIKLGGGDDRERIAAVRRAAPRAELIVDANEGWNADNVAENLAACADAGVTLRPSTLIVFGNPPLGTLFLTSNPSAGLDWPVRVLVYQDEKGDVWVNYTDFMWIAHRHGIMDRDDAFKKASEVITSITSTVQ